MQIRKTFFNSEYKIKNSFLSIKDSPKVFGLFFEYCLMAGIIMGFMVGSYLFCLGIGGKGPLYAEIDIHSPNVFLIFPIVVFTAFFFIFCQLSTRLHTIHGTLIVTFFIIFSILIDITVAMTEAGSTRIGLGGRPAGGIEALVHPFVTRASIEHYGFVKEVRSASLFLKDFVSMLPSISGTHVSSHPPGPVLFLWAASKLFGGGVLIASLSVIIFGSLSIIPVYLLSRDLYGKEVGFYSIALYTLAPNIIMYTATSMDGIYPFFSAWSIYLFYKTIKSKFNPIYPILSGLSLAIGTLMTIGVFIIGVSFAIISLYYAITGSKVFDIFLKMLTLLISILGFYFLLYITTGFNALECFIVVNRLYVKVTTSPDFTERGSYFYWLFGNLAAILLFIGVPTALLFLKEAGTSIVKAIKDREIDIYVLASVAILIALIVASQGRGEMERLTLFLTPFFIIPSAKRLLKLFPGKDASSGASMTIIILFVQTMTLEFLLYTYW